jgi:hypothetical protein
MIANAAAAKSAAKSAAGQYLAPPPLISAMVDVGHRSRLSSTDSASIACGRYLQPCVSCPSSRCRFAGAHRARHPPVVMVDRGSSLTEKST